ERAGCPVGVDDDRGRGLRADLDRRRQVEIAVVDQPEVHRNARDAVRVNAPEICPHQHLGDDRGVGLPHPRPAEPGAGEAAERVGGDGRGRRRRARRLAHRERGDTGKYLSSQFRRSVTTSVLPSESTKWSTPATRWRSVGCPAWRKRSIDCSVGVTESLAGCRSRSGRGEILPTTSLARKAYMLSTTSNGNSMIEPGATLRRSAGGIGTIS